MFGRNVLCLVDFNKFICVHINSINFLNKNVFLKRLKKIYSVTLNTEKHLNIEIL